MNHYSLLSTGVMKVYVLLNCPCFAQLSYVLWTVNYFDAGCAGRLDIGLQSQHSCLHWHATHHTKAIPGYCLVLIDIVWLRYCFHLLFSIKTILILWHYLHQFIILFQYFLFGSFDYIEYISRGRANNYRLSFVKSLQILTVYWQSLLWLDLGQSLVYCELLMPSVCTYDIELSQLTRVRNLGV